MGSRQKKSVKSRLGNTRQRNLGRAFRRLGMRQLTVELLEDRRLLAVEVNPLPIGVWQSEGAAPIIHGRTLNIDFASSRPNPVSGAIRAIAAQADNPGTSADESKIAYVGSVNGGVWRTADIYATNVDWEPQTDSFRSGAIGAIAISPLDGNIVYAGTGKFSNFKSLSAPPVGLYRTVNGNSASPQWERLNGPRLVGSNEANNVFEGLAITSIALSPTDSNVILVGAAGNDPGLYRSEDAGDTWTHVSGSINAPDGLDNDGDGKIDEPFEVNEIDGVNSDGDNETDEADEFNFPPGTVTDIAFVPGTNIVYAGAITARKFGGAFGLPIVNEPLSANFFVSEDSGITWTALDVSLIPFQGDVTNAKLAIHHSVVNGTTETVVYMGVIKDLANMGNGRLDSLFRLDSFGMQEMELPDKPIHPGDQGEKNFSIVADPLDPTQVYIGGDRLGDEADYSCNGKYANLLRGTHDPSTFSTTWEPIICSGANNTAPHSDSRDMKFIPGHPELLLQADDGGIYALDRSGGESSKTWKSKIGDLQLGEVVVVGYNSTDDLFLAGLQDNGVTRQTSSTNNVWDIIPSGVNADASPNTFGGDGYVTLVDPNNPRAATILVNNFNSLYQVEFNANGTIKDLTPDNSSVSTARKIAISNISTADSTFDGADTIQIAYHNTDPSRMFVGYNDFYELSAGKVATTKVGTILEPSTTTGTRKRVVTALSVGTLAEPDVAYVARGSSIAVRRAGESTFTPTFAKGATLCDSRIAAIDIVGFPVGTGLPIVGIEINPDNWQQAFAVAEGGKVYETKDGGTCWNQIPFTFPRAKGYSLELVNPTPVDGDEIVVVGTNLGVYRSQRKLGEIIDFSYVGTGLPNVIVKDIHYDPTDDLLYVGTLGRGVWKLSEGLATLRGEYLVTGTSIGETIEFRVAVNQGIPTIEVRADGMLVDDISVESYGTIRVDAGGGSDTIVIDNTHLFLGAATHGLHTLYFDITGGEDGATDQDTVRITNSDQPDEGLFSLDLQSLSSESGVVRLQTPDNVSGVVVGYRQVEKPLELQVPSYSVGAIGAGLRDFAEKLSFANGSSTGGIGTNLLQTINGQPASLPNEPVHTFAPEAFPAHIADSAFQNAPLDRLAFLRRLIEKGDHAFRLEDVGVTMSSPGFNRWRAPSNSPQTWNCSTRNYR